MWRWIFVVVGGVLVLKVAADAVADAYRAHPVWTVLVGIVAVGIALAATAMYLDRDEGSERIELRRASQEYGARADAPGGDVDHVVNHHTVRVEHHHTVEHVHRYVGGEATVHRPGGPPPVIEGVVVRRAIEGGMS